VKTVISTDRVAAVELLRKGDVVALPTETVYGLAAKAVNPIAVAKIFEAKERPRFDPLIVHLPNRDWLGKIVDVPAGDRQLIGKLTEKFWPGPFTMILPKREIIPDIITAGLDTVAVRLSAHRVFAEIVAELDEPLAAPSANRFGRISPTTAQHVLDELDERNGKITIFRRGPVTHEQLSEFAEVSCVLAASKISSPGQLPSHYAPRTPLRLIDNAEAFPVDKHRCVGLLAWNGAFRGSQWFAAVRVLTDRRDLQEAAANLFRYLRELDTLGLDLIVAERVPPQGLGAAIMDRLERAAHQ
jgi:L-threonylcarbamoyladenylate synthase